MEEDVLLKIKAELEKRKIKRFEFAQLMGITPAYLSEILNGKKNGNKVQKRISLMLIYLNI